jgi:ribosomal-protein-serine acetyltransferase
MNELMPDAIIVNDDIKLVKLNIKYASTQYNIIDSNREFFRQWLGWVDSMQSVYDSSCWMQRTKEKELTLSSMTFHILYKDLLVGQINLFDLSEGSLGGEIGYWLDKDYNGKGIMTQSVRSMLQFGFKTLELHRIVIKAAVGNTKSKAIPQKLGFTFEGIAYESTMIYDRYLDMEIYSMLDHQFK